MTGFEEDNYISVCSELDRLSLLMLDMMKEYIDCKVLIESYIKTGSLHLAKARYIMGNKSVSALQLPNEDCNVLAQFKILHSDPKVHSTESLVFEIDRLTLNLPENDVCQTKGNKKIEKTRKTSAEVNGATKEEYVHNSGVESTTAVKDLISTDPLKWFGVLVPQNLKYAQTNFSKCLYHVVQCTNLQMEINSMHSKYTRLMQVKKNLPPHHK